MNHRRTHTGQDTEKSQAKGDPSQELFSQALQHLQAGRLKDAEQLCQKIVAINPRHAHSLHIMGLIALEARRYDVAEGLIRKALAEKNDFHVFYNTLGNVLKAQGKLDDAIVNYEKTLAIKPDFFESLLNLGNILFSQEKYDDALKYYERVISIKPDPHAHANTAFILQKQGQVDEAITHYKLALELMPNSYETLNNLGTIYNKLRKYDEAVTYYKRALAIKPRQQQTLCNYAGTLKNLGRPDEAIAYYKQALEVSKDDPAIYSDLLLVMIYASSVSPDELAKTARHFGERLTDKLRRQKPLIRDPDPDRMLRIGYVSPDFREHSVVYFFAPLLQLHNRQKFEIFAYSNTLIEDGVTEQLKQKVDHWRDIRSLNDDAAADIIEADEIDILIDPTGHTANNRLMVFARKPAPIQVTWLGYPATTGMKAMDYRITDNYGDPPGMTEHLNTETLWRLPEIFCCYQAHENSPAVIDHPPFEDNGYITFGCFNNFTRVTDPTLSAWAKIMAGVPNSHLLLEIAGIDAPKFRAEVEDRMERLGLPVDRVILEPRKRENQFVLYNKIDIALDPFPCVGGATSMDTLWMGVPLVTLAGNSFLSRIGVTVLTNAGLSEFIAQNTNEYIKLAVDLAQDRERLKKLRHNLRDKVAASPLMNQESFARNMESAYREMWRKWCASGEKETR